MIGCDANYSQNTSEKSNTIDHSQKFEHQTQIQNSERMENGAKTPSSLSQNNSKSRHSEVFDQFVQIAIEDGYTIDTTVQKTTAFPYFSPSLKQGEKKPFDYKKRINTIVKFDNIDDHYYKLKRKEPTTPNGDTYPRFDLVEFEFENETVAQNTLLSIDSIISCKHGNDIVNEKKYDYILRTNSRLIYIYCNSMYFSQYAFQYKKVIEKLIEKQTRKS